MADVNARRRSFLSLSKLVCGLQEFNSRKFHLHSYLKRVGVIATTFEKTRIRFNSDVFTAVAVVVTKAPFCWLGISVRLRGFKLVIELNETSK